MDIHRNLTLGYKMYYQPDEFYIEAVSNASMNLFPENTLSKFTNRLQHSISLDGDWVVGLQEIFYPIDLHQSAAQVFCTLYFGDKQYPFSVNISEGDSKEKFISKFNSRVAEIYTIVESDNATQAKRSKREQDYQLDYIDKILLHYEKKDIEASASTDKKKALIQLYAKYGQVYKPIDVDADIAAHEKAEKEADKIKDNHEISIEKKNEMIHEIYQKAGLDFDPIIHGVTDDVNVLIFKEYLLLASSDYDNQKITAIKKLFKDSNLRHPVTEYIDTFNLDYKQALMRMRKVLNDKIQKMIPSKVKLFQRDKELAAIQKVFNELQTKIQQHENHLNKKSDEIKQLNDELTKEKNALLENKQLLDLKTKEYETEKGERTKLQQELRQLENDKAKIDSDLQKTNEIITKLRDRAAGEEIIKKEL